MRLRQTRRGHRAGWDAVLLAQAAEVRPGDHVLDLGSGSGAVGLMIAARVPDLRLTLVERDPVLVGLARQNLALNALDERGAALAADLFGDARSLRASGLVPGTGDVVVTNPPFFQNGERASPDPGRRAAHAMEGGDLASWLGSAGWLLRPRGRLWLVHRADALESCLAALRPGFGSCVVAPVYSKAGAPAARILVSAVKGGRAPLAIAQPVHRG